MKYPLLSRWVVVIVHMLFWTGFFFASFSFATHLVATNIAIWSSLTDVLALALLTYLNVFVFLPFLFKERKYALYSLAVVCTIAGLTILRAQIFAWLMKEPFGGTPFYFAAVFPLIGFFLLSSTGWFVTNWFQSRRREVELVNSQLESELKFLKLQLNPHFLFNTLNNIYSLAYFNDKNTPQAIMKLSDMMRHMIYECQDPYIALTKEVAFIENFIELQKIKTEDSPAITFRKKGIRESHQVAPLLFLAFLENSFKHGQHGSIEIDLEVDDQQQLHFRIVNQLSKQPTTQREKSGVGLINVQKRLELIYPDKHKLDMELNGNTFTVDLTLTMA